MVIRKASQADKDLLTLLVGESFRDVGEKFSLTKDNCPNFPSFSAQERIESDFEKGVCFYILEKDHQACGCVAMEKASPQVCYLRRLGVLPDHRYKGYGRALVEYVIEQARQEGIQRVEIALISKHRTLKKWYKTFGFTPKNTKRFEHLPFIVAYMAKDL